MLVAGAVIEWESCVKVKGEADSGVTHITPTTIDHFGGLLLYKNLFEEVIL